MMKKHYLVTGGAGFIGSNYVHRLLKRGEKVTIYDNLARGGAPRNLEWLKKEFGENAFDSKSSLGLVTEVVTATCPAKCTITSAFSAA